MADSGWLWRLACVGLLVLTAICHTQAVGYKPYATRHTHRLHLSKFAPADTRHEIVPFGMAELHGVLILANGHPLIRDFHGWTAAASGTEDDFDRFHVSSPPFQTVLHLELWFKVKEVPKNVNDREGCPTRGDSTVSHSVLRQAGDAPTGPAQLERLQV